MFAAKQICSQCGVIGKPYKATSGSILIEVFLWLMFIVPGLLYSLWRLSSKKKVCRSCGAPALVPLDSPRGRVLVAQYQTVK